MNHWNIAIATDPGHAALAEEVRSRLAGSWRSSPEARFTATCVADLGEEQIEQLDAAVLIVDAAAQDTPLLRLLSFMEELHVPVVALLDRTPGAASVFGHTSVLIEDRRCSGTVLCARLHGMLHRQREVNMLRREIAVAIRSHDGLEDEVARMHNDLQLAAQAQRGFLPGDVPSLHGITVASMWRPARYVSGDIYDVVQLDDDRLGLFLADAVGHGMAAALMTMVICQSLVTKVRQGSSWRVLRPADVLSRLNARMMRRTTEPMRFATAVYAVLDCRSRRLTLAGAGHPPPIVVRAGGGTESLSTSGGLLGVFKDEKYDEVEVELRSGDRLLIYTDGFEQAFPLPDGDRSRLHVPTVRYRQEFEEVCSLPDPKEMIDAIGRRLDSQLGSLHQVDDLTLLCIHAGKAQAEASPIAAAAAA